MDTAMSSGAMTAAILAATWKIAGAVALWLVGRWLISLGLRLFVRALARQQFDVTLTRYM